MLRLLVLVIFISASAQANWNAVANSFNEAIYDSSSCLTDSLKSISSKSVEYYYWKIRTEDDPESVLLLIDESRELQDQNIHFNRFAKLQEAQIYTGLREYNKAADVIFNIATDEVPLSTSVQFWKALTFFNAKKYIEADESFTAIEEQSPEYYWATFFRGIIAFKKGNISKAQTLLKSVDSSSNFSNRPDVLWAIKYIASLSDTDLALETEKRIRKDHSQSIASSSECQGIVSPHIATTDSVGSFNSDTPGRYLIQFAAFHDRGLAITFIDMWKDILPGIHSIAVKDDGNFLYKIRLGSWNSRPDANTACKFYLRNYELESIVIDTNNEL